MFLSFLIAFFSLIFLLILHEFGHFILAKKFGVKVEEFGIFYPPRIFAKRIGQTVYSLNLLPLGAFVKIYGERKEKDPQALGAKSIWQRALVILGGVLSFWIISAVLFSIVMGSGFTQAVTDIANGNLADIKVQIVGLAPESPAEKAGLKIGDVIVKIKSQELEIKNIDKVSQVKEFIQAYEGEVTLIIQRGREIFDVSLTPRVSPPTGEGPMGVGLVRTAQKRYPPVEALFRGTFFTLETTYFALKGWGMAFKNLFLGLPTGIELMGPVGVFSLLSQAASQNINYFLQFVATISIYVALFNILPIPPTDGGKLVFLFVEKLRGKKVSEKLETAITSIFLLLLIVLMILTTIKDIQRIF